MINGTKHLSNSNTPFNFNTPYIHQASKKDQKRAMSDVMLAKLDAICEQAERYINGERSQEDLFEDDEKKTGKGKKGNKKSKKQLELAE